MRLHWLNKVVIKYKYPIVKKFGNYTCKFRIDKFYVSKNGVQNVIEFAKKEGAIKKIYILN